MANTISFAHLRRDLVAEGLSLLLGQYQNSCVLRQFVAVFLRQCQDLYDAIIDMMEGRTLNTAKGVNLDAIGRIVGQERIAVGTDATDWMMFDTKDKAPDSIQCWCYGASLAQIGEMSDQQLRDWIVFKILKNHAFTCSMPETTRAISEFWGLNISFQVESPYTVSLYVPATVSSQQLYYLRKFTDTLRCDRDSLFPYPATLSFTENIYYRPKNSFWCDKDSNTQWCDAGRCAVNTPIE